ncbi:MAG: chloride channel protein [Burkholderiaceae bacterium]|jgi:H+/Cl- antiporter ClcA|nr:chloride channel protein [Burkholderiaceae bacterium]
MTGSESSSSDPDAAPDSGAQPVRRRVDPDFYRELKGQVFDGWRWLDRVIVLACAAIAGGVVVLFTLMSDAGFGLFGALTAHAPWLPLIWTPLATAGIVWLTRHYAPLSTGSGIPQVIAAQDPALDADGLRWFVSLKLTIAKLLLGTASFVAGLSVGKEGPSVQIAAGVLLHSQRWLSARSVSPHALLVAGGAAGIAAAFNAPLAGVVFAFEELSHHMEARYSGIVIAAIVLAGLIGVSAFGDKAYFGTIHALPPGWPLLLPGLTVTVVTGLLGGLFAKLMIVTLTTGAVRGLQSRWTAPLRRLAYWRRRWPVLFAAALGLVIAVIGLATEGTTFGSGVAATTRLLHSETPPAALAFGPLKFLTTWLTAWSGVPGGIFAPSLSVGAGIGYDIARLWSDGGNTALIAIGMAGFLAAVTQAPITSFLIVMEMIDGRPLVLSLMAVAMVAAAISRMISRPLYATLAANMLAQFKTRHVWVDLSAPPAAAAADASAATAPPAAKPE